MRCRRHRAALSIVFGLIVLMALLAIKVGPLFWTGDEPRYCSLAIGLIHGHLDPTVVDWYAFVNREHLDFRSGDLGPHGRPIVSFWLSAFYAPWLAAIGLEAARWVSFLAVAIGLALVAATLMRTACERPARPTWARALVLVSIGLSVPVMEYSHLVYPEALLFLLVALALYGVASERPRLVVAAAWILPFVHIRALPVAVVFFAVVIVRARLEGRRAALRATLFACTFLASFAIVQVSLYGKLGGLAFAVLAPSPEAVPVRLGMELFDARHGLITLWPLGLVAIAGLVAGNLRRDRLCGVAGAALAVYAGSFLFASASESYGGRYWVAAMPLFAVGLAAWLDVPRNAIDGLAAVLLWTLSGIETIAFELNPGQFLDDRRGSHVFANLSQYVTSDLGLSLPLDGGAPGAAIAFDEPVTVALTLAAVAIAALSFSAVARSGVRRRAASLAAVCALAVPVVSGLLRAEPSAGIVVRADGSAIATTLASRVDVVRIDTDKMWSTPPYPRRFFLTCTLGADVRFSFVTPARELIAMPACPASATLSIASDDPPTAHPFDRATTIETYRRLP